MRIRSNHQEDGKRNTSSFFKEEATTSCGSAASGSHSTLSEMVKVESIEENVRFTHFDLHGDDDARSQVQFAAKKKKRCQRVGGENRGLRQFSMKLCEKVESKGRTTYKEVADELVAEYGVPSNSLTSQDQHQDDEKNIRRRVYDALNVLMAIDIISREKKEIQWKGLPCTTQDNIEELKAEHIELKKRIEKKASYLQDLEEQYTGLQNLIKRNEQLFGSENASIGGIQLPFLLVQTHPHATVEVEISEDMQLVHLDFTSTPFKLHDDNYILKEMGLCEGPPVQGGAHDCRPDGGASSSVLDNYQTHLQQFVRSKHAQRATTTPPLPGILKPSRKHGQ